MKYLGLLVSLAAVLLVGAIVLFLYARHVKQLPQTAHALLTVLAAPQKIDRILVVSPHPDDETLGVAGYLHQAAEVGAAIQIIYATDGNKHGLKERRQEEAAAGLAALGVLAASAVFYDYPDGKLAKQAGFSDRLRQDALTFKSTKIFTTLPEDLHSDHTTCGQAVSELCASGILSAEAYFFLIHYKRYSRPIGDNTVGKYLLPPPQLADANYDWLSFPLTDSDREAKLKAITSHRSQLRKRNPVLTQIIMSFDRKNELFAKMKSTEIV